MRWFRRLVGHEKTTKALAPPRDLPEDSSPRAGLAVRHTPLTQTAQSGGPNGGAAAHLPPQRVTVRELLANESPSRRSWTSLLARESIMPSAPPEQRAGQRAGQQSAPPPQPQQDAPNHHHGHDGRDGQTGHTNGASQDELAVAEHMRPSCPPQGLAPTSDFPDVGDPNAELFHRLLHYHAAPLREFILNLALGPVHRSWLETSQPIVRQLIQGAKHLDQQTPLVLLTSFDTAMYRANAIRTLLLTGRTRRQLLATYDRLADALPGPFEYRSERALREPGIVDHLLRQVPGMHKAFIDRLHRAGYGTLEALRHATEGELTQHAGLDRTRASALLERFQRFDEERANWPTSWERARARGCAQLMALLSRLDDNQQAFQQAELCNDAREKRRARNERHDLGLEIGLLLLQLGETDLVHALERLPTDRKALWLRHFLALQDLEPRRLPVDGGRTV